MSKNTTYIIAAAVGLVVLGGVALYFVQRGTDIRIAHLRLLLV